MVANKAGLYIVDPERKGAAPSNQRTRQTMRAKRLVTAVNTWKSMLPEVKNTKE